MSSLEEWFFPHANRLSQNFGKEDWKGRIPILVEDAWNRQQIEIDMLNARLALREAERELTISLVELLIRSKNHE